MTTCPDNEILAARHVDKDFGDKAVLRDINLSLRQGEIVTVLGVSGSGKTTIFNIIAGLMPCDKGDIMLHKQNVGGQKGRVAYMLQKDLLLRHLTVIDNVSLPFLIKKVPKKTAHAKAFPYLETFGLQGYENKYPNELSGGMAQRAAFLRTYMSGSDVVLLDEPFSALDAITKQKIHEWFLDIFPKLGISILLITHDIDEGIRLSNRIVILDSEQKTISHEITIKESFAERQKLLLSPEYIEYKQRVLALLR